jgi:hypothetical protein
MDSIHPKPADAVAAMALAADRAGCRVAARKTVLIDPNGRQVVNARASFGKKS